MNLTVVERNLRETEASPTLVEPRLLRKIIKAHRSLSGIGLLVPHARAYALDREKLRAIVDQDELGRPFDTLPQTVILLARPTPGETLRRSPQDLAHRLWRDAFHERVHVVLEGKIASGELSDAMIRARIDRIGQIEVDEARAALRHDDRLFAPYDDRGTYVELAALYLELRHFAPTLLERMFPSLAGLARVDAALAEDVDAHALLAGSCPEGVDPLATIVRSPRQTLSPTFSPPATLAWLGLARRGPPSPAQSARSSASAEEARRKGNDVRAALLHAGAGVGGDARQKEEARARATIDLESLATRLDAALAPPRGTVETGQGASWIALLWIVTDEAAQRPGLRYPVEARLLYDLQSAAIAAERPNRAVSLVAWAMSRGKTPLARPLPATREVRIARHLRAAAAKVKQTRVAPADRKLLAKLLLWAVTRADRNVRLALRPILHATFADVGLAPSSVPERVARDKLVEELLDQVIARGFVTLGQLRDALSRNQLKLDDLKSARELLSGDAVLAADARLSRALDGVYRGGEIYLRGLQKLSSLSFGTRAGRIFTLYFALPFGAAFVLLEGVAHVVGPIGEALGFGHVQMLTTSSFLATSVVLFILLHSASARDAGRELGRAVGFLFALVFLRVPRWILSREIVVRALRSRAFRLFSRRVFVPLVICALAYAATPLHRDPGPIAYAVLLALFVAANLVLTSRIGVFLEEVVLDSVARTWRDVSHRVLPGLFRLIADTFRKLIDLLERGIYQVDEWLRFREGERRAALVAKAVTGVVWGAVAYVVRLYITLLIEPELNPLKHFPVVTVAHKILLPLSPELLRSFGAALAPLGSLLSGTIAGTTVFLLPSVFGFLVWELKENWKLYRATRPMGLVAAQVGGHGETMGALLVPGFHSGTLPKLFERIRRAAQQSDEERTSSTDRGAQNEGSLGRYREAIDAVELSIARFVERELLALLIASPRWNLGPVTVSGVTVGSNRVRVRLLCPKLGREPCEVAFEEQSRLVLASVPHAGFLAALPSDDARLLFENALAGLYQLAGVDLVREQIEDALRDDPPYDIADEGLVVWAGGGYETEVVYRLTQVSKGQVIEPTIRGAKLALPPPPLWPDRLFFRLQNIAWPEWVAAWEATEQGLTMPRLVRGASILPRAKSPRSGAP